MPLCFGTASQRKTVIKKREGERECGGLRLTDVEKKVAVAFIDSNKMSPEESEELLRLAKENDKVLRKPVRGNI